LAHQRDGVGAEFIAQSPKVDGINLSGFEVVIEVMDGLVKDFALESEPRTRRGCPCVIFVPER
jgi:hypothetical protein